MSKSEEKRRWMRHKRGGEELEKTTLSRQDKSLPRIRNCGEKKSERTSGI